MGSGQRNKGTNVLDAPAQAMGQRQSGLLIQEWAQECACHSMDNGCDGKLKEECAGQVEPCEATCL